jgi:hypothetical protein
VHEGLKIGTLHLDSGRGFMGGMAAVAEELISLMGLDVVIMAVTHENAKEQVRVRVECVCRRCMPQEENRILSLLCTPHRHPSPRITPLASCAAGVLRSNLYQENFPIFR